MRKTKLKPVYIVFVLIFIIGVIYVLVSLNSTGYTILKEDVNNSCREDDLSTATAQRLIEIKVPTDKVDEYLEYAAEENRCVYRGGE